MKSKITRYLFTVLFVCTIVISVDSQTKSPNPDSFILACGTNTESTDYDSRKWNPDVKFLNSPNNSLSAIAKSQDPSLPSTVPYMTSRIFKSESTYKFLISPNSRHWIRLYFYPSSYNEFNTATSFFSVTAGGFTLLKNFSAFVTADALTQAYIIKEFSMIKIASGTLNLTFTPNEGSFAFVNGIEIVSMPDIFQTVSMVGSSDQNMDIQSYTVQTMYRLNVGGQYISPTHDSGLTRIWYDDSPYIFGAASGVATEADKNVSIKYPSNDSKFIAPDNVYRTARSMGPNSTVNANYNLTWVFQIDVNFTYLVRLHFCEFQLDKLNQIVFTIFINNRTAEPEADVIAWSTGKNVPVYKDYSLYINGKTNDDQLWVALHPNVDVEPQFHDSILNGLEIFKVSDTRLNLAGPNPVPSKLKSEAESSHQGMAIRSSKSSNIVVIIGSVLGSVACLGLLVSFIIILIYKKRKNKEGFSNTGWLPIYGSSRSSGTTTTKSSGSSRISNLGGGLCRHFTLAEIKLGTDNFSESRVIGVGGFGKVFMGYIDGKTTTVAIKRANPSSEQGLNEFQNEIELLSKLRHRHLVSLIGACEENSEMILVYDYMANGTLREHLYKTNSPLNWKQRLNISIGAARGIHYLHTGAKYTIIHRDVKSTNILLDDKWVAKVSDFGLSKTGPTLNQTHVSTVVKGSFGYLDPEYFRRQQLTDKSDVYSFGVVLFEILCGRPALNPNLPKEQVSLADWALSNHRNGSIDEIIDPVIKGEISCECMKQFIEIAVKCLSDQGLDRPSMGAVLWNLEYCLQLQNNPDGPKVVAEKNANEAYASAMHATLLSIEEEGKVGDNPEGHSANAIFSQIVNQQGR